ncbi:MAG: hypothetical protein ACE5G0_03630 [Rhodothermales bacterium]
MNLVPRRPGFGAGRYWRAASGKEASARPLARSLTPVRLLRSAVAALLVGACMALPAQGQTIEGQSYAVLIGGLGGSPEYTDTFQQYLFETHKALIEDFLFPEANVTVLAETSLRDVGFVTDVSTADNIRAHFATLAATVTPNDHVYIVLFGHGSYDGEHAQLNIPRRDLNDADYAALVDALPAGRIIFVNTASASAPFIDVLSAPDRIVITATRRGTQRNETVFPKFLVEGLTSGAADLDKNGNLSVREVFAYAAQKTAQSFAETSHLATEHALLEDTGDTQAYRVEELDEAAEGNLAAITYLKRRTAALAAIPAANRAALAQLLGDKDTVERDIAELKSRKNRLRENDYYAQLETLFVHLARLNDRIEAEQGGNE